MIVSLLLAACGSSSNPQDAAVAADMSAPAGPDMSLLSRCGHPGDTGNSLGVGLFCTNDGPDCGGNSKATLCSALVNGQTPSASDSYFCTFQCATTDPPGTCGENAACVCSGANCACVPARCIASDGGA